MRHLLVFLGIAAFVALAFYVNSARHAERLPHHHQSPDAVRECAACREKERERTLGELRSVAYLEHYIERVINEGSRQNLGFAYGDMPAGMADAKAAPRIAAYVVTLAGLKPTHPEWVKEGHTFYVSNCGGCHGEDGRGVHGTFPDLTRVPMLGIERRIKAAMKR
ncbi:c-type cytochrome [Hydrogenimonas sp.]